MSVLYVLVWTLISIAVAALAIGLLYAKHHRHDDGAVQWYG